MGGGAWGEAVNVDIFSLDGGVGSVRSRLFLGEMRAGGKGDTIVCYTD